uniref:Large ribosomal subunit protein eL6 n=1 Tax=Romanomermis culicivorax TaxID=13658 RepID=A0A915KK49_ROMCU
MPLVTKERPRNYELVEGSGLMRFSRARMHQKRAFHIKKKYFKKPEEAAKAQPAKELYVTKKIGGDKNGGERKVLIKKPPQLLDSVKTKPKVKYGENSKKLFKNHKRYLRPTLTPGTVCIVLVGPHKGKRVVFLKQLESGLLLVTGPHKYNGYPLRRINQIYLIATKTKLDISGVKLPEHLNDKYFARSKKSIKKGETDIFAHNKQEYVVSEQRKKDQKLVDQMIIDAIKKREDKGFLKSYLKSLFELKKGQYPHNMVF